MSARGGYSSAAIEHRRREPSLRLARVVGMAAFERRDRHMLRRGLHASKNTRLALFIVGLEEGDGLGVIAERLAVAWPAQSIDKT